MKTILLFDLGSSFWRHWHGSADQEISTAFERTVGDVWKARRGFDYVAVCADGPPYKRRDIHPEYKANRAAQPPQAYEQLERVKERIRKDGTLVWQVTGYEADDILASAVPRLSGHAVTIASADKDLLSLVDDSANVSVLSPMTGKTLKEADVIARYGVHPREIPDFLALWGDASDNIPGIPGVGEKTAAKLIAEFGTLEGVLTHADDIPQEKLQIAIREHAGRARLARKVIELMTDAPIDVGALFKERAPEPLREALDENTIDDDDPELDAVLPPVKTPAPTAHPSASAEEASSNGVAPAVENTGQSIELARPTALARGGSYELGLEPTSLGGAFKLARGMYESRLYSRFPTPEAIWAVIIRGRELGLGALTALDCFHVIEGKPALHAHLIVARAKAHPDCEYFYLKESTPTSATYETKNRSNPEPTRMTYTLDDAKRAGLCPEQPRPRNPNPGEKDRRSQWEKRPGEMCRKSAAVQLARAEYPAAALGLYSIEELGGDFE